MTDSTVITEKTCPERDSVSEYLDARELSTTGLLQRDSVTQQKEKRMSLFDRGKDFGRQLKKNVGRIRSGQPEVSKQEHSARVLAPLLCLGGSPTTLPGDLPPPSPESPLTEKTSSSDVEVTLDIANFFEDDVETAGLVVDGSLRASIPSYSEIGAVSDRLTMPMSSYWLRVYRADGTYHIVECPVTTSVSDLSHILRKKLPLTGRCILHLRERGQEYILDGREKPIKMLRRRLQQAGYDESDGLSQVGGEDLGFLLQFVFRDPNLAPTQAAGESNINVFRNFAAREYIDLTGRSLFTIPIAIYQHAPNIVVLNLSKNPHIDVPLDFVAACTALRDLRLSFSAITHVAPWAQHMSSLSELDLSRNRMATLDGAGLEAMNGLRNLQVQNNRLASLPSRFSEMRALKFLNISNNNLDTIPNVLPEIKSLVELDLSFNTISVVPPELGGLINLERLTVVGNRIEALPEEISTMVHLKKLDVRRNAITGISPAFGCPALEILRAGHNCLQEVELPADARVRKLCLSNNGQLASFTVQAREDHNPPALGHLGNLIFFKFDHNNIRTIPEVITQLSQLKHLSGSYNDLTSLPATIGRLTKLESLYVHNNNIKTIPASIWECRALLNFNASSNLITSWGDPVDGRVPVEAQNRQPGATSLGQGRPGASLASSLQRLYLADNRLNDDVFHSLAILDCLLVLNLSFNNISELPPLCLPTFTRLEELYLSGNKLTSLPEDDLHFLRHLQVLFLNANKLRTLPAELSEVKSLTCLDVGSNNLKYNIANWQFDWNWNFNRKLRYLNLSGNNRLEIKNVNISHDPTHAGRAPLPDFQDDLRLLGLMDVTLSVNPSIPEGSEECRVRTTPSSISNMVYGVADTLGMFDGVDKPNSQRLGMFDLAVPCFRGRDDECLFGMFGQHVPIPSGTPGTNNLLASFLHRNFSGIFQDTLKKLRPDHGETVPDALRRAFLALNKGYYESLKQLEGTVKRTGSASSGSSMDLKNAASGLVLYVADRTMYVANIGNIRAVVARNSAPPHEISKHHDPFDLSETARIRTAGGCVSSEGTVNDELDISRAFGAYHLNPIVNACPYVITVPLTDQDEFVIIGNQGLWNHISPRDAVDIARLNKHNPMVAAKRLRDYAISYGAQGCIMVMVVAVGNLFHPRVLKHASQPTAKVIDGYLKARVPRETEAAAGDRTLARLQPEIPPPTGHLALVFTGIHNFTRLWETNPGMPTAMKLHNSLLRRQLREVGGYEVKTEGGRFVVAFQSVATALLWCFNVQLLLMQEEWPLRILESLDGRETLGAGGQRLSRGLRVRMGIHWGAPNYEHDPITSRMDYFGPVVNRASGITESAEGGQIMASEDAIREIGAIVSLNDFQRESKEAKDLSGDTTLKTLDRMGVFTKEMGEARLPGIAIPEALSLVYPGELVGRFNPNVKESAKENIPIKPFESNIDHIRSLATLGIRLEALASGRVFRDTSTLIEHPIQYHNTADNSDQAVFMHGNAELLVPIIHDEMTEAELALVMESLSVRVENAIGSIYHDHAGGCDSVLYALEKATRLDPGMLIQAFSMFSTLIE